SAARAPAGPGPRARPHTPGPTTGTAGTGTDAAGTAGTGTDAAPAGASARAVALTHPAGPRTGAQPGARPAPDLTGGAAGMAAETTRGRWTGAHPSTAPAPFTSREHSRALRRHLGPVAAPQRVERALAVRAPVGVRAEVV